MAFAMTTQGPSTVFKPQAPVVSGVVPPVQIADTAFTTTRASGTTAAQNLGFGCTTFQVIVYIKTLVLGANTLSNQGPYCCIEAADNSGMTTNLTVLGGVLANNVASSTSVQCFVLTGITPVASKQYVRVVVDPTGMGAG